MVGLGLNLMLGHSSGGPGGIASVALPLENALRSSVAFYFDDQGVLTEAAIDVPRVDYDPVTLLLRGYQFEGQRTNSIRNPRAAGGTVGVIGSGGVFPTNYGSASVSGLTREIVGFGNEDGIPYIDLRVHGTPGATSGVPLRFETITGIVAANAQQWVSSVFCRLVGGSLTGLASVTHTITGRTAAGATVQTLNDTIFPSGDPLRQQRRVFPVTLSGGTIERITSQIGINCTNGIPIDVTLRIGAPQLELGPFASSVILPPVGSPAATTRNADTLAITPLTGIDFNTAEGSMYALARTAPGLSSGGQTLFSFTDGTANNRITVVRDNTGSIVMELAAGGVQSVDLSPGDLGGTTRFNLAVGWAANNCGASLDSNDAVSDLSATIPTVDQLHVGGDWFGWIERLDYYAERLLDA